MKKRIFVMYGTQPFPFERLDKYINQIDSKQYEIKAQIGNFGKLNDKIETFSQAKHSLIIENIKEADIIISHGGVGSIFDALLNGKNPIVLPRLKKFNEHVDDHQLEIVEKLSALKLIQICQEDFSRDLAYLTKNKFEKYESDFNLPLGVLNEFKRNN